MIVPETREISAYRRSPSQVALLHFFTLGAYLFYWAYMVRKRTAAILGIEERVMLKTIGLVVPILNLFLIFELGARIRATAWRASSLDDRLPPLPGAHSSALPWLGILAFFLAALSRLPDPFWFAGTLDFVPIFALHLAFARAQIVLGGPSALPTNLKWPEWLVIAVGGALFGLALVGSAFPESDDAGYGPFSLLGATVPEVLFAIVAVVLLLMRRTSERAVRASLTRYEDADIARAVAASR